MQTPLSLAYADSVGTLTLHAPEGKPPTLDHEVMQAFESLLTEVERESSHLVALVVRSSSPKFFCAGANLKVMEGITADTITPWVLRGHGLMNRLEALPLPVIARVEGYAMGGGLELAMACDLIIASSTARFAQSEAKLGLVTGWGGAYRLARRVGLSRAKELCFTGRMLEAEEACRLGVIDWAGSTEQLDAYQAELLAAFAANSRSALRETKRILATVTSTSIEENGPIEAAASVRCLREGDASQRLEAFFAARRTPKK